MIMSPPTAVFPGPREGQLQGQTELGALSAAAFDATHFERLARFFDELPAQQLV